MIGSHESDTSANSVATHFQDLVVPSAYPKRGGISDPLNVPTIIFIIF